MDNVIAFCWVIQDVSTGVESTIYLQRPDFDPYTQKVFMFFNVFEARKFIQTDVRNTEKVKVCGKNNKPSKPAPHERRTIVQNNRGW